MNFPSSVKTKKRPCPKPCNTPCKPYKADCLLAPTFEGKTMDTSRKALEGKSQEVRSRNRGSQNAGKEEDPFDAQNTYSGAGDLPQGHLGQAEEKTPEKPETQNHNPS